MNDFHIPKRIHSYIVREKLGSGSFSSVFLALDTNTNLPVAIKAISKSKVNFDLERIKREIELLKTLDHPFIVAFYESIEDNDNFYLVQEYVEGKTIFQLIQEMRVLPEWHCRHIFCQLISALDYLHLCKNIVHRDLKAENVIIDMNNNIRLIDFGFGIQFSNDDRLLTTACGSPAYAPPEMFRGHSYTSTVDLWSAGVLLYAMAVGKLPFQDPNMNALIKKICTTEPDYPETMSPDLTDLLHRMMMKDPMCRMSIQKIQSHPWFVQYHFAKMMDQNFGLKHGLRIASDMCGADVMLLNRMAELSYDGYELYERAKKYDFSSDVVPYRIVHRYLLTSKLRGMFEIAEREGQMGNQHQPRNYGSNSALRSFQTRRQGVVPQPATSFTRGDRKLSLPSSQLSGVNKDQNDQSLTQRTVYRTAALNTFANVAQSFQRRTSSKRYSFGTPLGGQ